CVKLTQNRPVQSTCCSSRGSGFQSLDPRGSSQPSTTPALLCISIVLAVCQALENSTSPLSDSPVAAAVVSHFNDCPDSHTQFCFHGTCRFLVQEEKPACVCHNGYVGARCEHADLLAVVAASQKKQAITALVVVSIVALAVLIITCVLIHCCHVRKHCEWCRALVCRHEKPSALLKGRTACCHSETGQLLAERNLSLTLTGLALAGLMPFTRDDFDADLSLWNQTEVWDPSPQDGVTHI
ncbi:hypothetical protein STEG23_002160, partial [Scotinomys teguina]